MKRYNLEFVAKCKCVGFKKPTHKKVTLKLFWYNTKSFIKTFDIKIPNNNNDIVNIQTLFIYNLNIRPRIISNEKNSNSVYIIKL